MKKLMKISLIAVLCLIGVNSFGQTFGVRGGLNFANMEIEDWGFGDKKMNPGFHLGATVTLPYSDAISFESGLMLSTKGLRISETDGDDKFRMSIVNNYLDIPIKVKYSIPVNETMSFYGEAGPYVGIALSGKFKYKETYDGETDIETESVDFGGNDEEDDFKRLDYGLTLGGGLDVGIVEVGVFFDLGLANISSYEDDAIKNRVLRVSVAYKF